MENRADGQNPQSAIRNPQSADPAITFEGVSFALGDRVYLRGIDLQVGRGERLVVFGRFGCGKSFLLRLILGMVSPREGTVRVNGVDLSCYEESELYALRRSMGVVFRGARLIGNRTVWENVALPLSYHTRLPDEVIRTRIERLLVFLGIEEYAHKRPVFLDEDVGMKAAVARAFALDPEIMIYDDPTAGLCPIASSEIVRAISELSVLSGQLDPPFSESPVGERTAFIASSEVVNYLEVADRFAMLDGGRITFVGTSRELLSSDDERVRPFVRSVRD